MISFFEFLNTCSPLRATSYMAFVLMLLFFSYSFIDGIVSKIFNKGNKENDDTDYEGVIDDGDAID